MLPDKLTNLSNFEPLPLIILCSRAYLCHPGDTCCSSDYFQNHNMLFSLLALLFVPLTLVSSKPLTHQEIGDPGRQDRKRLDMHHAGEAIRVRDGVREIIVPVSTAQAVGPSIPKFGHGAIPKFDNLEGQLAHDDRYTSMLDAPDTSSSIAVTQRHPYSLRASTGDLENLVIDHPKIRSTQDLPPLSTSIISLTGPSSSTAIATPIPFPDSSTITTNSSLLAPSTGAASGCTTTIMGSLSNPCRTDGTFTVHTSSITHFSSINCGGCTAVHVVEPMWGCPLATAGMATTTASTPYMWTSTVCEPSFVFGGDRPSVTVTMFENITATVTAEGETTVTETEILDTVTILTLTLTKMTSVVSETVAILTVTA